MIPPTTAIVAFAILFGHPLLQLAAAACGARVWAATVHGRAASYGAAALAGLAVAFWLSAAPFAQAARPTNGEPPLPQLQPQQTEPKETPKSSAVPAFVFFDDQFLRLPPHEPSRGQPAKDGRAVGPRPLAPSLFTVRNWEKARTLMPLVAAMQLPPGAGL